MVITVVCGWSSWPTMGDNSEPEETYTVTVKQEGKVPTANVTIRPRWKGYLHGLQIVEVPGNCQGISGRRLTGWVSFVFGYGENFGFFINQGYPNDGTESPLRRLNGTLITDTAVQDGDTVDFSFMATATPGPTTTPGSMHLLFLKDGEEATVTVKGLLRRQRLSLQATLLP